MKIISAILIIITAILNLKHGWTALTIKPGEPNMLADWGIGRWVQIVLGIFIIAAGIMVVFPQTFVAANAINAATILLILILQLKNGNTKAAVIEIPFLLMPVVMLWLGYPLALLKYIGL
jgi:hypothetical protein